MSFDNSKFNENYGVTTLIPNFLYGTAWKEERTAELVEQALKAGFVAIDAANQRKHYFEEGVGIGIKNYRKNNPNKLINLFLQTKFTYARGQDHRKPYDENLPFEQQVEQSLLSSFQHLNVTQIDSFLLHGPYSSQGISKQDEQVWRKMEELQINGKIKYIGISNFNLEQLKALFEFAKVKPRFVQIRTFASRKWEKDLRTFCLQNGIIYQGFSLLTANKSELQLPIILEIAKKYKRSTAQVIFKFSQQIGILPITGTTDFEHMKLDLNINDFKLTDEELFQIENINFLI